MLQFHVSAIPLITDLPKWKRIKEKTIRKFVFSSSEEHVKKLLKNVGNLIVGNTQKNKFRESAKKTFEAFEKITLDKSRKDFQRI